VSAGAACAALLVVAATYWIWLALAGRSITTDPGISVIAAQGILEHGLPVMPSGFIYDRSYFPNYLIAGAIGVFGLNDLSVALPSLLMALGSLWLTYLIARDVLARPWIGVVAVILSMSLEINSHYAASPRMYMPLQFFTLLSIYSAWRGFFQDSSRFRVLAVFAVVAAGLTHQQGGILAVGIPLAFVLVHWLEKGRPPSARELRPLLPVIVLLPLLMGTAFLSLPGAMPHIAMHASQQTDPVGMSGLNLRPRHWLAHVNWLEHAVPLGVFLAPAAIGLVLRELRQPPGSTNRGLRYLLVIFVTWAVGVLGYIRVEGTRFWVGILPIYILLLVQALVVVVRTPSGSPQPGRRVAAWGAALLVWGAVAMFGYGSYYGSGGYARIVREGFGRPCGADNPGCSPQIEARYRELAQTLGPGDLVISTNPFVASYYLGRADGWLTQLRTPSGYAAFDSPIDEYFGAPLVDRESDLLELSERSERVWVVVESHETLNPSLVSTLKLAFRAVDGPEPFTVYVNEGKTR
jgi:4-amino-4-deoxy-L-arabinose transferase-like glycosyltransferase